MDLGWVFWDNGSRCFHHTQWGKNGPRCKEGEQLLLFWLSHGEKNPAPFQQLVHVLKMVFVTRRDGIKVGEKPLTVWAQQYLLMFRKTEYTSEEVSAPSPAKDSFSAGLVTFPRQTFSVSKCKARDEDSNCLYNQSEVCEDLII